MALEETFAPAQRLRKNGTPTEVLSPELIGQFYPTIIAERVRDKLSSEGRLDAATLNVLDDGWFPVGNLETLNAVARGLRETILSTLKGISVGQTPLISQASLFNSGIKGMGGTTSYSDIRMRLVAMSERLWTPKGFVGIATEVNCLATPQYRTGTEARRVQSTAAIVGQHVDRAQHASLIWRYARADFEGKGERKGAFVGRAGPLPEALKYKTNPMTRTPGRKSGDSSF